MQTLLNALADSLQSIHRKLDALYLEFEHLNARLDAIQAEFRASRPADPPA